MKDIKKREMNTESDGNSHGVGGGSADIKSVRLVAFHWFKRTTIKIALSIFTADNSKIYSKLSRTNCKVKNQ